MSDISVVIIRYPDKKHKANLLADHIHMGCKSLTMLLMVSVRVSALSDWLLR